MKEYET